MAKDVVQGPQGPSSKAWEALSMLLPRRSSDCDYWWKFSGKQLAIMVDAAGYTMERQYEALLFHYHWIVPYLGPAPAPDGTFAWPSIFSSEGLPIEYSWKWNTGTAKPVIRYTIEAKHKSTGTATDPLNQEPFRQLLHSLQESVPGVDLTWTNHLLATLYDHDRSKYAQENARGAHVTTTVMLATELEPSGLSFKSYFVPRQTGLSIVHIPLSFWKEAVVAICPENAATAAVYDFLSSAEGKLLRPFFLAVDNVKPQDSRLKFYFLSPHAKFSSIRDIMTLGGRVPIPNQQLQDLRELVTAVTSLEGDLDEDAEPPLAPLRVASCDGSSAGEPEFIPGCGYYFNIASGCEFPEVKVFLKLNTYGPDDLVMTHRLTTWMGAHGRGEYCQRFSSMLEGLSQQKRLINNKKGVYSYLACMFKGDGQLEVTTYLRHDGSCSSG